MKILPFILLFIFLTTIFLFNKELYLNGNFKIIDGDTLYINNTKCRIYGIDAPEIGKQKEYIMKKYNFSNESCLSYYGIMAKEELEKILKNYKIKIEFLGTDKYNRTLCKLYNCTNFCEDIGKFLVLNGLAFSYNNVYLIEEKLARKEKRNLWSCT